MGNRHHRMGKQHSGPGKTHDFPDFLPHDRFVAMYLTVGTEGFRLHKRTLVASHPGIGFQICTFGTKSAFKRGEIRKQAKSLKSSRLWTAGKQVTTE